MNEEKEPKKLTIPKNLKKRRMAKKILEELCETEEEIDILMRLPVDDNQLYNLVKKLRDDK